MVGGTEGARTLHTPGTLGWLERRKLALRIHMTNYSNETQSELEATANERSKTLREGAGRRALIPTSLETAKSRRCLPLPRRSTRLVLAMKMLHLRLRR